MEKDYEIIEHTSDTGILAYGRDELELVNNLISGFDEIYFEDIPDLDNSETNVFRIELELKSNNYANLLVDLVNEIIFLIETENIVFIKVISIIDSDNDAVFEFITADITDKFNFGLPIKAATYHQLLFKTKPQYFIRMIFDV